MVKGISKPELYVLFFLGAKPKQIKKMMPDYSMSTIYYYGKRTRNATEFLIKRDLLGSDKKLKIDLDRI